MKNYLFIFFLFIFTAVKSQENSPSSFDRPDIIEKDSLHILKSIESEISLTYNEFTGGINNLIPPFVLVGMRVSKKTEMRFTFNYEPQSNRFILYDNYSNFTTVCVGEMTKIIETNNWMSDIFMVNNLFYPYTKFSAPDIKFLDWESIFLFQNEITRRLTFNYTVGYVYFNYYLKSSVEYSACVNYYILPSVCLFAEHFGFYHGKDEIFEPGFDCGLTYRYKSGQWDLCYARNYYAGINLGFVNLTYGRNLPYKTTRKR